MTVHAALWRGYETEAWLLEDQAALVPTAEQVQAALAGQYGTVVREVRVEHRTRGGNFLADLTSAWVEGTGHIECDNSRAVVVTGDLTLFEDGLPDPLDHIAITERVAVRAPGYMEPVWVDVSLGLYRPAFADRRTRNGRTLVTVRLNDLVSHLVSETLDDWYEVAAGTPILTALGNFITSRGLRHAIPTGGAQTPVAFRFGPPLTSYGVMQMLAFGANYYTPWVNRQGFLVTRERINPSSETSAVHYSDGDGGALMVDAGAEYVEPTDNVLRNNRVVVVAENPDNTSFFGYVEYRNDDPASPASTVRTGQERVLEMDADSRPSTLCLLGEASARAVARFELHAEASLVRQAELATFADPRREPHEYYRVTVAGRETAQLFRVLGWRRPLGRGHMTHRLARVSPVTLTEVV